MSNLLNWPHWVIDLVEENDHIKEHGNANTMAV
jgi:hypothetical protein